MLFFRKPLDGLCTRENSDAEKFCCLSIPFGRFQKKKILFQLEDYYRRFGLTRYQHNILTSYLARQMIGVCQLSEQEGTTIQDKKFIRRNARDIKSIGKMILFFTFHNHYQVLSKIIKKIIRY